MADFGRFGVDWMCRETGRYVDLRLEQLIFMRIPLSRRRKWLYVALTIISMPIIAILASLSIRVFHFPWTGPILMTLWFGWVVWFLFVHRPFSAGVLR